MRRIVIAIAGTVTGLVLLVSYPTSQNRSVHARSSNPSPAGASDAASVTPTQTPTLEPEPTPVVETYDGTVVDTEYGEVQVRIVVTDGAITAADAIQHPYGDEESDEINAWAVPELNALVLEYQSAGFDLVSDATVTSEGYIESLQSALDQAGL